MILLELFWTFFKIGAFTFGGGYAMIPLIQREAVEKNKWISDDDILEIIAIAESTPGPIAINSATFVGYKVCGFCGSSSALLRNISLILIIHLLYSIICTKKSSLSRNTSCCRRCTAFINATTISTFPWLLFLVMYLFMLVS